MAGKAHRSSHASTNVHETFREVGQDVVKSVASLPGQMLDDAWKQWFGSLSNEVDEGHKSFHKGDLKAGEPLVLNHGKNKSPEKAHKPESLKRVDIAPGINYFAETFKSGEHLSRRESSEIQYKVQEIMMELKRLVDTSTVLQAEFKEVTMSKAPATPGKYHLNFFDWVLTIIRAARMKVEDSGAWLASMKGKKGKNGYWNMFKKHGTSFGLSSERSTATQTG